MTIYLAFYIITVTIVTAKVHTLLTELVVVLLIINLAENTLPLQASHVPLHT